VSDLPPLTRRTALRLLMIGTVGVLAGCRSAKHPAAAPAASKSPSPSPTAGSRTPSLSPAGTVASPTLSPDEALAHRVALAEAKLISAYDAAARDHPELAVLLAPLRADHAAHADALVPNTASPPPASPPPATTPSAPATSTLASAPVGGVGAGAGAVAAPPSSPSSPSPSSLIIGQLIALEHTAAAARVDDLVTTSGSLARLLASIGGCEAAHAALLSAAA
jgi:hypothetical protein